jgi:molybdopterin-containing oxidoreductase family iron-sulfur binding subunit
MFLPVLCNHCEQPTCADLCPTKATYQRDDGVVMIDYERCIRCCACIEHCPYQVRTAVRDSRTVYADGETVFEKPVRQKILNKVATKGDFCYHRVDTGIGPSCCEVCPAGARVFGDLSDDASKVSLLIKKHNGHAVPVDAPGGNPAGTG